MGSTFDTRELRCEPCGRTYLLVTKESDYPDFREYQCVVCCPEGHETTLTLTEDTSVYYPDGKSWAGAVHTGAPGKSEWKPKL